MAKANYTTPTGVQTYLSRTLNAQEIAILTYVIPGASRWIDRALGSYFGELPVDVPFDVNNPANPLCGWRQKHIAGGYREISVQPCQQILTVQAINPYDFSVWYTYTAPLEYTPEPYDLPVHNSLRMNANEFTGHDLRWPGGVNSIMVTALFTEYDYETQAIPNDIVLLCNHISAVWLQNNDNTDAVQRESVEGHEVIKRVGDLLAGDPMFQRVLDSRQEVWLEEM